MQTAKEDVLKMISKLPDKVDLEDIMYRLYVMENIHHAEEEEKQGNVISHEELGKRLQQW